jgi:uncharacterized membrane protein YqhA
MINRLLSLTRYFIAIAVGATLVASVALLVYGALDTLDVIYTAFSADIDTKGGKTLMASAVAIVDIFLVATVMYIVAIGLYSLFVDDTIKMPAWLEIHTLDDLKERLLGVVVVALAVLFLGAVIDISNPTDLLVPGITIGFVIGAITFFLRGMHK